MKTIRILGIDPALRNFGFAVGEIDLENNECKILDLYLSQTKPEKKRRGRKSYEDLNCATVHSKAIDELIKKWNIDYVSAEIPIGSQSARAMASYGICIGIISNIPKRLFRVTPDEVKLAGCGIKTATKEEMIEWATAKYPNSPWRRRKVEGKLEFKNDNEHLADACGVIEATLKTKEWLSTRIQLLNDLSF